MAPGSREHDRAGAVAIAAWVLYDWAYGAFTTIVTTFVFATYFTQAVAPDPARGAALWAGMQAVAGVAIALLSVPLGAVADRGGRRRAMLAGATALMVACTLGLWTVHPRVADCRARSGSPARRPSPSRWRRCSTTPCCPTWWRRGGWAGCRCWAGARAMPAGWPALGLSPGGAGVPHPPLFGLDAAQAEPVRATALLAGAWLALFAWPALGVRAGGGAAHALAGGAAGGVGGGALGVARGVAGAGAAALPARAAAVHGRADHAVRVRRHLCRRTVRPDAVTGAAVRHRAERRGRAGRARLRLHRGPDRRQGGGAGVAGVPHGAGHRGAADP